MIDGHCDTRFGRLRDEFAAGFADTAPHREIGASVSVWLDGRLVVDLWGGRMDPARARPWQRDTIVNMMSVGKAMLALVAHMLAERGALDLDAPVARLWPEFAAAGKGGVLVRHFLDHTGGLPHIVDAEPDIAYDWARTTAKLAAQVPHWPPGTVACYHTLTVGFLLGEVIRRAAGARFADAFRDLVAGPLGAEYGFCLGPDELARCAEFVVPPLPRPAPGSLAAHAYDGLAEPEERNSARHRQAELYAVNGHGNARGIARIYAALAMGGEIDGVRLLSPAALARATAQSWRGIERLTGRPSRMSLGFRLPDETGINGLNEGSFGHGGRGGAMGFADPVARLAFGYAPSHPFAGGSGESPRTRALRDAAYACL